MLRKTLLAACLGLSQWVSAATFELPTDGSNMVGTLQYTVLKQAKQCQTLPSNTMLAFCL